MKGQIDLFSLGKICLSKIIHQWIRFQKIKLLLFMIIELEPRQKMCLLTLLNLRRVFFQIIPNLQKMVTRIIFIIQLLILSQQLLLDGILLLLLFSPFAFKKHLARLYRRLLTIPCALMGSAGNILFQVEELVKRNCLRLEQATMLGYQE